MMHGTKKLKKKLTKQIYVSFFYTTSVQTASTHINISKLCSTFAQKIHVGLHAESILLSDFN